MLINCLIFQIQMDSQTSANTTDFVAPFTQIPQEANANTVAEALAGAGITIALSYITTVVVNVNRLGPHKVQRPLEREHVEMLKEQIFKSDMRFSGNCHIYGIVEGVSALSDLTPMLQKNSLFPQILEYCGDKKALVVDGNHRSEAVRELLREGKTNSPYFLMKVLNSNIQDSAIQQLMLTQNQHYVKLGSSFGTQLQVFNHFLGLARDSINNSGQKLNRRQKREKLNSMLEKATIIEHRNVLCKLAANEGLYRQLCRLTECSTWQGGALLVTHIQDALSGGREFVRLNSFQYLFLTFLLCSTCNFFWNLSTMVYNMLPLLLAPLQLYLALKVLVLPPPFPYNLILMVKSPEEKN